MKKIDQIKNAFRKSAPVFASAAAASFVAAGNASAALVWTGVNVNTADVETLMAIVITGLATLWGFRKIIKTMNRS